MAKLLYKLEDHFDALADEWQGYFVGSLSVMLRGMFAAVGDILRPIN